jgi:hypothetical protein
MSFKKLKVLFGAVQSDPFTPVSMPMTSANFLQVAEGFSVDLKQEMSPLKQITGDFGQTESVPGFASCDVKIKTYIDTPIVNYSTANPPLCEPYLLSSGMTKTDASSADSGMFHYSQTYTPSTIFSAMTFESHMVDGSTSTRTIAANVIFDAQIALEVGKPASLSLTGKGILAQAPDTTTAITGVGRLSNQIGAVLNGNTATFMGDSYKLLKADVKLGNKIEWQKDFAATYGYANPYMTDRATALTMTVYCNDDVDVLSNLMAGTIADCTCSFGGAQNLIEISAPNVQIKDVKPSDDAGINTYEIQAIVLDNDWSLTFNSIFEQHG